jgi:nicotinamidase-related amidase
MDRIALLVVDVQKGFADPGWGERNNLGAEDNIAALVEAWREQGQPVVFVRHDGAEEGSSFTPGKPGNDFDDILTGEPDLLVTKTVNSAFHGQPDLGEWLRGEGIDRIAVCGIQTNMCCETTARVAANMGFEMDFVLDATYTFGIPSHDGGTISAAELARVTAANLDPEFGRVLTTRDAVAGLSARPRAGSQADSS